MRSFFHPEVEDLEARYNEQANLKLDRAGIKFFLEIAYDYADHLFDIRFDPIKHGVQEASKNQRQVGQQQQKVQKFYRLLDQIKDNYKSFCTRNKQAVGSEKLVILYHLTIGNICMRIEQWHLDNYHYKLAEQWYSMATGALWQGVNKAEVLRENSTDKEIETYRFLLMLNIGKCCRNYAEQNRRSDFLAAIDKFEKIKNEIEEHLQDSGNISRELALIWADAAINIARIHRHMYRTDSAKNDFFCILSSLSAISDDNITIRKCEADNLLEVTVISEGKPYEITLSNVGKSKNKSPKDNSEVTKNILTAIEKSDQKSLILQVLIEFGMLLRKERNYSDAVKTFIVANLYDPEQNIDAVNNISSALRKYITTSDAQTTSVRELYNSIQTHVFEPRKTQLLNQLKTYARHGNLYALREFIRWHGDCFRHKNKKVEICTGLDSTHLQNVLNSLGSGLHEIIHDPDSFQSNSVYDTDDIIELINILIKENRDESMSDTTTPDNENVQLLYLRGTVELQFQYYNDAAVTFRAVCSRKEASYIRRGTLGLKARYQLAQCYMAMAEFRKARDILQEIRYTLEGSLLSRQAKHSDEGYWDEKCLDERCSDAAPDFRVERDYGYCLMQLGSYEAARVIYQKIHKDIEKGEGGEYRQYSQQQISMSLNNYASCLIHTGRIDSTTKDVLDRALANNKNDKVTNLLLGYCCVCGPNPDLVAAQNYFDIAYGHDYDVDLNPDFYGDSKLDSKPNKIRYQNRAEYQNVVEQRSAYIINLTKIWNARESLDPASVEKARKKIKDFLSDISPACILSLNAAIALAKWLCEFDDSSKEAEKEAVAQLYRSFAMVSIYPEHGSRAFMEFKADPDFRYFQSDERGEILARLLVMYRHIKGIKEERCISQERLKQDNLTLVHYTSISTLKLLLAEKMEGSELPPRFRVSNCGYMNDVFEGSIFLDRMRDSVVNESFSVGNWNDMVRKYFPHLFRSEENMIPVGRNVYIASLSFKPDSFPLWSIYANNETGCNIEFSKSFFDILAKSLDPAELKDYLISKYTDDDYPVYAIKYLDNMNTELLKQIFTEWKKVDTAIEKLREKYLVENSSDDMLKNAIDAIHTFAADRINEVRFLYKDEDYKYEGEARVVVTTSKKSKIDEMMSPPRAYAEVDRTIDNISVRLGSRIDDATVDQLVTWLKLTGKVREVKLSKRNRRTIDTSC